MSVTEPATTVQDDGKDVSSATSGVLDLVIAHAALLARAGELEGAAAALEGASSAGNVDARALDLLAKVRAQQRRWDEAEANWKRANSLGGPGRYDAALKRVQQLKEGSKWTRPGTLVIAAASILVLLVVAGVLASGGGAPRTATSAPPPPPPPPPLPVPIAAKVEAKVEPVAHASLDLDGPGIKLTRRSDGVALAFDEGLFSEGAALTPTGARVLEELGARLKRLPDRLTATISGYTDDIPVARGRGYPDNQALGLARATAAMNRLQHASGWPANAFFIRTLGGGDGPFPNDSVVNRRRNRTVVIEIGFQDTAQ